MLPRLQAEEHLADVAEQTAADSWVDRRHRQNLLDGWRRQMQDGPEELERMTEQEFRDRMAAMGLLFEG